jgi:hypothetical protein
MIPLSNISGGKFTPSAANQLLEFKLPTTVYNLSRSYIQYSLKLDPVAVVAENHNRAYSFEDLSIGELAQSVTFGTASGLNLVDLNYLQNYEKVALKAFSTYDEFISRDPLNSFYPATIMGVSTNTAANEINLNMSPFTLAANTNNYNSNINAEGYISPFKLTDPKYSLKGPDNESLYRNRQIMLSDVKDTLLAEDKDFYMPIEMYLRLQSNSLSRMGVSTSNAADAALLTPAVGAASLAATSAVSNIYLYLAVEQNQLIIDELKQSVMSGQHKFTVPYTIGFKNNLAQGFGAVQIQLTSQYGKKLHHILTTVANNAEQYNTSADSVNWNGSKIATYQTFLDNRSLTDYVLSCAQSLRSAAGVASDDWRENKQHVKNKLMNYGQYQLNWFHNDAFYDPSGNSGMDLTNTDAGLDMEAVRLYQIQLTTAAQINLYTFATFLREVLIDAQGNIMFG